MPQMSPLSWLILMTNFIFVLFLFNNLNYFILTYNKNTSNLNKTLTSTSWKW
uniref:ATP synthase complex subunit 8 n=1 Tax=Pelecotoma fennica TaxID=433262 RepID=A0A343A482_9CUCU|nr:ATP synthase F0 subunit 8 [Pelecotoma fennica]AOY39360.1 ATP synthase F0 subunit 8 [Pelecotoma fennica]